MLKRIAAGAFAVVAASFLVNGAAAQSGEPVKIGFSMALTGPLAANGKQALLAMKIWEEETNAKGGLLGHPVKLVYYDDQSNPSTVPGIYTKLLDVDKVDLVVGPYGTNLIAPAMPVVMEKGKVFIGLFGLDVNHEFQYPKYYSMLPTGADAKTSLSDGFFQLAAAQRPTPQTAALVAADAEFANNACEGARANAKKYGFAVVYDKTYPPSTTDFTPVVRAVQAADPAIVVVCSYPLDSVGMIRAVNEVGYKPKMIGGAMVGLQATAIKNQLGPLLNGIVNYETWVPDNKLKFAGTDEFFKKYQARAAAGGVDPLGYYLAGWGYADLQILADAIQATKGLNDDELSDYLGTASFKTVMGDVKFGKGGEWEQGRMLQVQYHGIKPGAALETWRGMDYQSVLTPVEYKTGDMIYPYEKAKM